MAGRVGPCGSWGLLASFPDKRAQLDHSPREWLPAVGNTLLEEHGLEDVCISTKDHRHRRGTKRLFQYLDRP